ncbi:ATPase [Cetobacterium somerae]|uniref:ATPase n=1 Tax=Cetobacterium sp. NK01 TaxID=2993530 RepID=UPI002115DAF2|nr:ATPase [Cetobacterium sp. NK01]MCQ8212342.1 ATPase [Cetobacterium sp. NK01]
MFKDLNSNKKAIEFLQKELNFERESGTYLFYGVDRELLKKFAKAFAKSLNCSNYRDDFCDVCESCIRIESETHGDLEILDDITGIKIEKIRELAFKDSTTSYEGKRKIYIIRDVEKLRKESANALLKMIEEPNSGSFFILTSTGLNVLPTIKSRSILVNILQENAQEIGVTQEEYKFFLGKSKDIEDYKRVGTIDLNEGCSFERIGHNIKNWIDTGEFQYKVEIYKSIRDFLNTKDYLTTIDKLYFVDEIVSSISDREFIKDILGYTISLIGNRSKNLEKLLEIKNMGRSSINLKNLLVTFYTNI